MYISGFDISASNGPGVNECETIREMIRVLGKNAFFIIPEPFRSIDFVQEHIEQFSFLSKVNKSNNLSFIKSQREMIEQFKHSKSVFNPNMLLFRTGFCPFGQLKCAEIGKLPYVVKTLGVGVFNPTKHKKGARGLAVSMLQMLNEKQMRKLINGALAVDVVTTEYKSYFSQKYPKAADRIHLVENAVNTDVFKPMDKYETRKKLELQHFYPIIGYTGGSPYNRGGKLMIESAEKLITRFPNIGIVIVGPKDEQLNTAYESSPEREHIVLTDKVPYEEVPYYTNCFDVCVSCDTPDMITNYGNSSQKLRQYLACGKPVLSGSTQNTFFIEELKFGILILDMKDSNEFAEKACELLSMTDNDRMELSERATKYALDNLSVRGAFAQRMRIWENAFKSI